MERMYLLVEIRSKFDLIYISFYLSTYKRKNINQYFLFCNYISDSFLSLVLRISKVRSYSNFSVFICVSFSPLRGCLRKKRGKETSIFLQNPFTKYFLFQYKQNVLAAL